MTMFLPFASVAATTLGAASGATQDVSFARPVELSRPAYTLQATRPVDMNGDGVIDFLDCIQRENGERDLYMRIGLGSMTFNAGAPIATLPAQCTVFEARDVDGDGDVDIVAAVDGPLGVQLILFAQDSTGAFERTDGPLIASDVVAIRLGDVDQDGDLDVFVHTADAGIELTPVDAAGLGMTSQLVIADVSVFAVTDVDGDGADDLITVGGSIDDSVEIRSGGPMGLATIPVIFGTSEVDGARSISVLDLDDDGDSDIVVDLSPTPKVWLAGAEGGFTAGPELVSPGPAITGALFADVDGDGASDFVYSVAEMLPDPAATLWTPVSGTLPLAPGVAISIDGGATLAAALLPSPTVRFVDVDGDLLADLVDTSDVHLNAASTTAPGVFAAPLDTIDEPVAYGALAAVDLDGDGDLDPLAATLNAGATLAVFQNMSAFDFDGPADTGDPVERVLAIKDLADLNADGIDDYALIVETLDSIQLVLQHSVATGGFEAVAPIALGSAGLDAGPLTLDVVDYDGDGGLDMLLAAPAIDASSADVLRIELDALGAPSMPVVLITGSGPLAFADLDGDGDLDAIDKGETSTLVRRNLGAAGFSDAFEVATGAFALANDFDADGDVDLLTRDGGALSIASNLGAFTFVSAAPFFTGPAPGAIDPVIELVDIDRDGDLDIIVVPYNETLLIAAAALLNDGAGGIESVVPILDKTAPTTMPALRDLDGDSDLDALAISASGTVIVAENLDVMRLGMSLCAPAVENSAGLVSRMVAYGSPRIADGDLTLLATQLPPQRFGIFAGSETSIDPRPTANSIGLICLGGSIGRYNEPGEIQFSGLNGQFDLPLDPLALRTSTGSVAATIGSTWHFQAWYRDIDSNGDSTSNFSEGISVTFE